MVAPNPLDPNRRRQAPPQEELPPAVKSSVPPAPEVPKAPTAPTGNGMMQQYRHPVRPPAVREAAPTVGQDQDLPGVSGRLQTLLEDDSPYIQRARTRGVQFANRRGLLNSSIAAGASEGAAIDAALPIASADASLAAGERQMRSTEFMQARDHRVQQLMQQRGFDFQAAENQANRELQELMQKRELRVRQLMLGAQLSHDAAQRTADRELRQAMQIGSQQFAGEQAFLDREASRLAQERGITAQEAMEAARQEFAGIQANLDREAQRLAQERGMTHENALAQASREQQQRLAYEGSVRDVNFEYQRQITALELNTNIPIERRQELQEHYGFLRDQSIAAQREIYGYQASWAQSTRRPEGG